MGSGGVYYRVKVGQYGMGLLQWESWSIWDGFITEGKLVNMRQIYYRDKSCQYGIGSLQWQSWSILDGFITKAKEAII